MCFFLSKVNAVDDSLAGALLLGALLLLNSALKLAFVALLNASKPHLQELAAGGHTRARRTLQLIEDTGRLSVLQEATDVLLRFLMAVVAAQTLVPTLESAFIAQHITATLAEALAYSLVLGVVVLLILVLGEMLPAAIAKHRADTLSLYAALPVRWLSRLLAPVFWLLCWVSDHATVPFGGDVEANHVTEEEIKMLVDAGSADGAIESEEREMILSIFRLGDTVVRELMVPRIDIVALDIDTPLFEALDTIVQAGHSRIPVYEGSIDHVRGLLYAKDLLVVWRDKRENSHIREMLRPAYFVPESKRAVDLLTDLQQHKIHLAIVVDEYGGTAGLVTLEDLLEEIVGEIHDEYDFDEEELFQQVGENEYILDGGIDLDDLNRMLGINLPTEATDTLGGYVLSRLGKVPSEGETFSDGRIRFEVLHVDDRRVRRVRLTLTKLQPEPEGDIRDEPAAAPD